MERSSSAMHCPLKVHERSVSDEARKDCAEVKDQVRRQSGYYIIFDHNENNFTVYYELTSEPGFKWTLVESFLPKQNVVHAVPKYAFCKTNAIAVNEDNPDSTCKRPLRTEVRPMHVQLPHP